MNTSHANLKMRGLMLAILALLCLAALSVGTPGTVYGENGGQTDTVHLDDSTGGDPGDAVTPSPDDPGDNSLSASLSFGLDLLQLVSLTW